MAATHVCGKCGRLRKRDLDRKFCPVTAQNISFWRNADSCMFYIPDNSECEIEKSEGGNVSKE